MATSAELYASAQILGTECADANMAFLKCKAEAQHPRHCLEAGTAVTSCGDGLIARLKSTSGAEFEAFRACLADTNNAFDKCRAAENAAQRDANDARARKKKRGPEPEGVPSGLPVDLQGKKKGKAGVKGALERAQVATASLGQFDAVVAGEGKRPSGPARGRKRQFLSVASARGSDAARASAILQDLERPRAKRPGKGEAERMDTHDGELPNESGFKRKKGKAAAGKSKKITKKRGM